MVGEGRPSTSSGVAAPKDSARTWSNTSRASGQTRGWSAFADHDGVDGPLTASVCQSWMCNSQQTGAIHERSYHHDRSGPRQEGIPGAWGGCGGWGAGSAFVAPLAGSGMVWQAAGMPRGDGGLRNGALLGARAEPAGT